ncbi:hypothetical protein D3C77_578870 [compost metagenome]
MEVAGSPSEFTINNVSFNGYIDTVQDGKKVYAPSRILAALVDGQASWTTNTGVLTITGNAGNVQQFKRSAGSVKMVNDEAYIELHDFKKQYPAIDWSYQQGSLKLKIK